MTLFLSSHKNCCGRTNSVVVQPQLSGSATKAWLFALPARLTGDLMVPFGAVCGARCNVITAAASDPSELRIPTTKSSSERWWAKSASRVVLIAHCSSCIGPDSSFDEMLPPLLRLQCSFLDFLSGLFAVHDPLEMLCEVQE